jgi:hypothetical protein
MRNLGENNVKETDVGALAPATIGGTIWQAPVSGPAPVEAEVEVSFEGYSGGDEQRFGGFLRHLAQRTKVGAEGLTCIHDDNVRMDASTAAF